MFDRARATDVLKEGYLPELIKSLNDQIVLYQKAKKSADSYSDQGSRFIWPIHDKRNITAGIGRAEGETLQDPGAQGFDRASEYSRYLYTRVEFTGPVVESTKNNASAFIRAVDNEFRRGKDDHMKTLNRQLHSDGTDALGYYVSGGNTATGVFDDGKGNVNVYLPEGYRYPVQYVDAGGTITAGSDGFATATYLNSGSVLWAQVGAAGPTGYNVQLFSAQTGGSAATIDNTSADGDFLIPASSFSKQVWGLEAIVNDADPLIRNLHGVATADGPHWKSQVVGSDSVKRDISYGDMQTVVSLIQKNSPATLAEVDLLITDWSTYNRYVQLLKDEHMLVNVMKMDGGHTAVLFDAKPLVADPQAHAGRIYFLATKYLQFLELKSPGFIEKDGSVFHRNENQDAYRATLAQYTNFSTKIRNVHGLLRGII